VGEDAPVCAPTQVGTDIAVTADENFVRRPHAQRVLRLESNIYIDSARNREAR
jgi:hypothetical protein